MSDCSSYATRLGLVGDSVRPIDYSNDTRRSWLIIAITSDCSSHNTRFGLVGDSISPIDHKNVTRRGLSSRPQWRDLKNVRLFILRHSLRLVGDSVHPIDHSNDTRRGWLIIAVHPINHKNVTRRGPAVPIEPVEIKQP